MAMSCCTVSLAVSVLEKSLSCADKKHLSVPDVFGLFNNALLIMDAFAEAGYLALGLDYFHGVSEICRFTQGI